MSSENRKNIEEIREDYLKGLTFHYVDTMMQVIDLALTSKSVKNAINVEAGLKGKEVVAEVK